MAESGVAAEEIAECGGVIGVPIVGAGDDFGTTPLPPVGVDLILIMRSCGGGGDDGIASVELFYEHRFDDESQWHSWVLNAFNQCLR